MHKRVIAFGDVHGCVRSLRALLGEIQPTQQDTLVFLGDCVDHGPESREVISELIGLKEKCCVVPILGNHEEMMVRFLEGRTQADDWLSVVEKRRWTLTKELDIPRQCGRNM